MFFTYKSVQTLMSLKILIIGSGGREHAIAWLISKSKRQVDKIYVMPGNAGTITAVSYTHLTLPTILLV